MSKKEFFHSTPSDIYLFLEEKNRDKEEALKRESEVINYTAWLHGLYVANAVASVMSKKSKYPKHPLGDKDNSNKDEIVAREDMSDEEKAYLTEVFFSNLTEMQNNFEQQAEWA